ncbi:MAG: ATP-binding protein, partial [Caulobacteraceae bacterium]
VKAVLGVLTLQVADVNEIVTKQRLAMLPFILIAMLVFLTSSLLLNRLIAEPVRKLARAADQVRLSRARSIDVPEVSRRDDELGDLGRSLQDMTDALSERMDAIDRFAADVAHEIRNLIDNARSFTTLENPNGSVRVDLRRDGDEVVASVQDDGPGIPPENLETVFERFYTSRPKSVRTVQASGMSVGNSGLGLSIARQIVLAHGGRLWAENRVEGGAIVGACFNLRLPATP